MNEKVCRACFTALRTKRYVPFYDKPDNIPGCNTVQDALIQIVPSLNCEVIIEPVLCMSCFLIVQTTLNFKQMCLKNELMLLDYLEDVKVPSEVQLNDVIEREKLTDIITSEHDYIRNKYGNSYLPADKLSKARNKKHEACNKELKNEILKVTENIETCTETTGDILKTLLSSPSLKVEPDGIVQLDGEDKKSEEAKSVIQEGNNTTTENCTNTNTELTYKSETIEKVEESAHQVVSKNQAEDTIVLTCTKCRKQCIGYRRAAMHAKTKHNLDRIICCKLCGQFFYTARSYKLHSKIHDVASTLPIKKKGKVSNNEKRLCQYCGLTFTHRANFNKHMKRHADGNPIECNICNKPFYTSQTLERHILRKHRTEGNNFLCDFCGKHFTQYHSFYNHKRHHIVEGEFKCNQCDKVFTQRVKLRQHISNHTSERRYMCEICGQQCKYEASMRKHRKRHFSIPVKKLRFKCPVCEKGFETVSRMKKHTLIHTNIQPYHCELCGRRFNAMNNLKRHMLVHTGEKPFSCDFCGQRFTQKGTMKMHQLSTKCRNLTDVIKTKNVNNKVVYECETCGRHFKQYYWLKVHQQKHQTSTEICNSCDICGRKFSNRGNLRRHYLCHTGEKPFQCKLCGKYFRQKTELVVHMRRHTGEKPYKCDYCEKTFVDMSEQRRHRKRHYINNLEDFSNPPLEETIIQTEIKFEN